MHGASSGTAKPISRSVQTNAKLGERQFIRSGTDGRSASLARRQRGRGAGQGDRPSPRRRAPRPTPSRDSRRTPHVEQRFSDTPIEIRSPGPIWCSSPIVTTGWPPLSWSSKIRPLPDGNRTLTEPSLARLVRPSSARDWKDPVGVRRAPAGRSTRPRCTRRACVAFAERVDRAAAAQVAHQHREHHWRVRHVEGAVAGVGVVARAATNTSWRRLS